MIRRPWTLTLVADRVQGSPDAEESCPGPELGVATLNGQVSDDWEPGGWVDNSGSLVSSSYCRASTALWSFDSAPESVELELGELGAYSLDLPLMRLERLEPALGSIVRDAPIRFSVTPPLDDGAELSTFGHSNHREPSPFLGCWSEAWVDAGDLVGTADLGVEPSIFGFDTTACAVGVSIQSPPVELAPCGAASCSLYSELVHMETLSLEGY